MKRTREQLIQDIQCSQTIIAKDPGNGDPELDAFYNLERKKLQTARELLNQY